MDSDIYDEVEAAEAAAEAEARALIYALDGIGDGRSTDAPYDIDGEENWGFGVGTIDLPWKGQLFRFVDSDNPEVEQYVNLSLIAGVTVSDGYLYLSANAEVIYTQDADTIARFWDQWDII